MLPSAAKGQSKSSFMENCITPQYLLWASLFPIEKETICFNFLDVAWQVCEFMRVFLH